jgi:hypothetical protein
MRRLMFDYSGIAGYETFQLELSEIFLSMHAPEELPEFRWMKVKGKPFVDDVSSTYYGGLYNQLIISEKLWEVLIEFNLGNSSIEPAIQNMPPT